MNIFENLTLTNFTAKDRDSVHGIFAIDQIVEERQSPHAAIFECDLRKATERTFLNQAISGAALDPDDTDQLCLLRQWGGLYTIKGQSIGIQRFDAEKGPLMRLRNVHGRLIAVGSGSQVYERVNGTWISIGPDLEALEVARLALLTDVDGFSKDEIYVSGDKGRIFRLSNGIWSVVEVASNLAFHSIHCSVDGEVFAVGQLGLLVRGRGDSFELLSPSSDRLSDLWGVACYQGVLFCSGFRSLMEWDGEMLQPHIPAMRKVPYFYDLEIKDGVLWSCGEKSLLKFDGTDWNAATDLTWIPLAGEE